MGRQSVDVRRLDTIELRGRLCQADFGPTEPHDYSAEVIECGANEVQGLFDRLRAPCAVAPFEETGGRSGERTAPDSSWNPVRGSPREPASLVIHTVD